MTNGEKIKELFPDTKIITQYDNPFGDRFMVFTLNNEDMQVNIDWWNAEYKEPATKNDLVVDCISREAVERIINKWLSHPDYELKDHIYSMTEKIHNLPPVTPQEPRMIPVSERLPKADEYVGNVAKYYLVQNEYGDMLVARYTHSGYWEQIYQFKPYADEIVAWMPLPKGI